jgi:beta-glucosidase
VSYPGETLLAQTWDVYLGYAMGLSVGTEARSSDAGIRGWYGPAANIHRNPFGGRNGEYYSEDGLLAGKFAAEVVSGAKNAGLYCYMKHFVGNDSESLREGLYTFMTEQTLREIYLKPFELAVKEGGANALMTSMNRLGRVWSGASRALCTDILRGEWGFNGTLVTDWVDTNSTYMPVYKGIWAGNSIWLNNVDAYKMFSDADYANNAVFVTLAQRVAHDVLWTLVDTENARLSYDPTAAVGGFLQGRVYNHTWYVYIALAEMALFSLEGAIFILLIRNIHANNQRKRLRRKRA